MKSFGDLVVVLIIALVVWAFAIQTSAQHRIQQAEQIKKELTDKQIRIATEVNESRARLKRAYLEMAQCKVVLDELQASVSKLKPGQQKVILGQRRSREDLLREIQTLTVRIAQSRKGAQTRNQSNFDLELLFSEIDAERVKLDQAINHLSLEAAREGIAQLKTQANEIHERQSQLQQFLNRLFTK